MAKVTIDPTRLAKLIADFQALAASFPAILVTVEDLLGFFGAATPKQGVLVKCGPGGCTDCCDCLDCTIHCQVQALASAVQAKNCLDNPPAPTP